MTADVGVAGQLARDLVLVVDDVPEAGQSRPDGSTPNTVTAASSVTRAARDRGSRRFSLGRNRGDCLSLPARACLPGSSTRPASARGVGRD
jgi:hypothetical protein